VRSADDPRPPQGFDPVLSSVAFSFKVGCASEFDCRTEAVCAPEPLPQPRINYLAKDYASFRTLLLDRVAVTMPDWQERNPSDVGVALVELLAYAGDQLSYQQDAAAVEAYLGTARRRISVRRHARLLDYPMHDGCNARAWVALEVSADQLGTAQFPALAAGTQFICGGRDPVSPVVPSVGAEAQREVPLVFEAMHSVPSLLERRNAIRFYTWGDRRCCLPKGATEAYLEATAAEVQLHAGDVLILEEVLGAQSGVPADADPARRHAVRLDREPEEHLDPLYSRTALLVHWRPEDALPFPLCLWEIDRGGGVLDPVSVARANVVLVDHGLSVVDDALLPPEPPQTGEYRPRLARPQVTQAPPFDPQAARDLPASAVGVGDPRAALATVRLEDDQQWEVRRDLLASERFDRHFVVEVEEDGLAHLRFGDDKLGARPPERALLRPFYRIGGGVRGNVGAEAINQYVGAPGLIVRVRNPLPAAGGVDPEPIDQVRLYAPQALRRQERAVVEADYAAMAQRHPEVQRAAATFRWTGSWTTVYVTIDRFGGAEVDDAFKLEMRDFLDRYRMAGYDLEIDAPQFVPLHIVFTVCVTPDQFRGAVKAALLERFSNRVLADGTKGFFHPDQFTFGQPVYLSRIVAAAMQVPGVEWIDTTEGPQKPTLFRRYGQPSRGELADGRITMERLEIARLDNDPNAPENGQIDFVMKGGL
jgi:hypothetical protein